MDEGPGLKTQPEEAKMNAEQQAACPHDGEFGFMHWEMAQGRERPRCYDCGADMTRIVEKREAAAMRTHWVKSRERQG